MIQYVILRSSAKVPEYKTEGAAGFDLAAAETVVIQPMQTVKIPIGLAFSIASDYEINIRNRSGLTLQTNLRVWEGTIDSDYRGEINVIVQNISSDPIVVYEGERIAQGVVTPVVRANFTHCLFLDKTDRGDGGFGHSGVN